MNPRSCRVAMMARIVFSLSVVSKARDCMLRSWTWLVSMSSSRSWVVAQAARRRNKPRSGMSRRIFRCNRSDVMGLQEQRLREFFEEGLVDLRVIQGLDFLEAVLRVEHGP